MYFRLHIRLIKMLLIVTLTIAIPMMGLYSKTNDK